MERNFLERLKAAENFLERLSVIGEQTILDARTFGHPLSMSPPGILYNSAAAVPSFLDEIGRAGESMRRLSGPVGYDESGRLVSGAGKVAVQELINREDGPGSAAMTEAATRGAALAGGTSLAGSAPKGALRTFGGTAAKTADHEALKLAKSMAKKGATREAIWDKTGWFKGVDGKWRFEIDDSAAALKPGTSESAMKRRGTLSKSLNHDELFAAYPDMKDTGYAPGYGIEPGTRGLYRSADDVIAINRTSPEMFRSDGMTVRKPVTSTTMHEGQHAIQNREGFARGGNVSMAAKIARDEAWAKAFKAQDKLDVMVKSLSPEMKRQWEVFETLGGDRAIEMRTRMLKNSELAPLIKQLDNVKMLGEVAMHESGDNAFDVYRKLAGEVEARNVQERLNMTAAERRATPPWLTQDTPDADQIVRFGGDDLEREKANIFRYLLDK